jgi:UDP-2,3-diacylglucosamine pyrophosphatase LpxH
VRTTVYEDRLLVVSDIHMGNALHRPRRKFLDFVHFAFEHRYSICINGDGLDIAQLSLQRLNADLTPSLNLFARFGETGKNIYYTVGNHDLSLEHFLADMGRMKVLPFLNVYSGNLRIRVEHGHMYDEMFLKYPRVYTFFMMVGGLGIAIGPKAYERMHRLNAAIIGSAEWVFSGFGRRKKPGSISGIAGERECFGDGALNVGMRGFDAVTFGHTHLPGTSKIGDGRITYYNTGAWFTTPWCLAIDHGRLWFGPVPDLMKKGDPFPLEESQRFQARAQEGPAPFVAAVAAAPLSPTVAAPA